MVIPSASDSEDFILKLGPPGRENRTYGSPTAQPLYGRSNGAIWEIALIASIALTVISGIVVASSIINGSYFFLIPPAFVLGALSITLAVYSGSRIMKGPDNEQKQPDPPGDISSLTEEKQRKVEKIDGHLALLELKRNHAINTEEDLTLAALYAEIAELRSQRADLFIPDEPAESDEEVRGEGKQEV